MTLFQLMALPVLGFLLIGSLAGLIRRTGSTRDDILWSLLWLVAGGAIAWPESTVIVAGKLGIGRGADLVLYCSVVLMMVGFLLVYARLRRLRHQLTVVVRHIALKEASRANDSNLGD